MDERLCHEITKELYAQPPLRQWSIRQEDLTGVAFAVATRISRTFRIEWEPQWDDTADDSASDNAGDEPLSFDSATYHADHGDHGDHGEPW